jgi:hypothetical protein
MTGLMDTFYNVNQSLGFSKYYWRVMALNTIGNGGKWSVPSAFTVETVRFFYCNDYFGKPFDSLRRIFTYYHALGYNYALYYIPWAYLMASMNFNKATGHWIFNNNNYTDSLNSAVNDFRAFKKMTEALGLHVLPAMGSLSHLNVWINGVHWTRPPWNADAALSEFASSESFLTFAHANGLWPKGSHNIDSCNNSLNSVAWADDSNKTARDIYVEQLNIIQKNWGATSLGGRYPQYIHLGHDEIGAATIDNGKFICFVGEGKSKALCAQHGGGGVGKSWILAHEIKTRCGEAAAYSDPGVKIILWGDCLAPLSNGQSAGLTGTSDGTGGVLQFLRDTMKMADNCIIAPWNYWDVNGARRFNGSMNFNQNAQVAYIQKFGFGYILASGEAFNASDKVWCGMQNVRQHLYVAFEQVQASLLYPDNCYGFANMLFDNWDTGGTSDTLAGYTAPILAYFGWTIGAASLTAVQNQPFSSQIFAHFKPVQSRASLRWAAGKDYPLSIEK